MSDIAIKAEHVSKMYRLGVINNGTLFRDLQTWWALKRGKEDPHSLIGENKYSGDEDHFWALKDLNFEIKHGDRVGIIGKNGAGKSTLLKILSRVTTQTEGVIKIKGKVASLLEVGTGFHGELTGRENIYLNGAILGMKRVEVTRKLDEIIAFSGIDYHIDTPVKRYSSGMYVRLAFAVAAHLDSDILIADEVLAVGDAEFQKKAIGKMRDLSSGQGRTVLFVSHNLAVIKTLCNYGFLLRSGSLSFQGNVDICISNYINESTLMRTQGTNKKNYNSDDQKYFNFIDMFLSDSVGKRYDSVVTNDSKVFINIQFSVTECHLDLTVGFTLFNSKLEKVFRSLNTDLVDTIAEINRGKNHLICKIPVDILCPSQYTIALDVSIHNREWIIIPDEFTHSIYFEVVDNVFSTKYQSWTTITPQIHWMNHCIN